MKAEKKQVEKDNICGKCLLQKDLTQKTKKYGEICEDCYLEINQPDLTFDEYDLRPDELTKEQFAEKASVSLRAVEIWKKDGKIAAEKLRRRVNGVVRSQLIFKVKDVEEFLNQQNEPVKLPKVEMNELQKTKSDEQSEFLNASQVFVAENLGKLADAMNNFSNQVMTKQLPAAEPEAQSLFLTVKEASDLTRLAQAEIKRLIENKTFNSFKGSHGEILISRKELLNL